MLIYILEDDENIREIESYTLQISGYEVKDFDSPQAFYKALADRKPDLIILDIMLPGEDGLTVLKTLKANTAYSEIPVIIISSDRSPVAIERAYGLNAADFISRPFDAAIVRHRVVNTILFYAKQKKLVSLVERQVYEKERQSSLMIDILSHIVEFRNGESGLHVLHIRTLTELLLKRLVQKTSKYELTPTDITLISTASALHDIGKIVIPEHILNKPGKLTNEEFQIIKTHSQKGAEMISGVSHLEREPLLEYARDIARWHHERFDGRGYPDGLSGDEIPICAQVTAIADVYDALTSKRVYKAAYTHEQAVNMINNGECGAFDPLLLECLMDIEGTLRQELTASAQRYIDSQLVREMANELICD